jgi:ABC-2 type transport system permease protein
MIVGIPLMQMLLFGYAINFDVRDLRAASSTTEHHSVARTGRRTCRPRRDRPWSAESRECRLRAPLSAGRDQCRHRDPARLRAATLRRDRPVAQLLIDGSEPMVDAVAAGAAAVPLPVRAGPLPRRARPVFEVRTYYNPERRTAVQIVPALIGVILNMTMVIFTAAAIVRERERGNLELLIATPVRSWELMAGKLLPYVAIGLVQTTLILGRGRALFDVPSTAASLDLYLAARCSSPRRWLGPA